VRARQRLRRTGRGLTAASTRSKRYSRPSTPSSLGALDEGSRVGYFAAVYRKVTAKIAEGIAAGFFDDGERTQRLDVTFADRYLLALRCYQTGGMATKS
jgi:hypothetical protein